MSSLDIVGPQLSVLVAAGVILVWDALFPRQRSILPYLALLGLAVSAVWTFTWVSREDYQTAFDGTLALDKYAVFFYFLFTGIAAAIVLSSVQWVNREGHRQSEYFALVLTVSAGLMFLASARDLITIFLALELSSTPAVHPCRLG